MVIVSYNMMSRDILTLSKIAWQAVVLDEAHMIKNSETNAASSAFELKAKFKIALTGTPIQNEVEDIWSIFNFVIPGFLGNLETFTENYVKPIRKSLVIKQKKAEDASEFSTPIAHQEYVEISAEGLGKFRELHKQILPFTLRRLKSEVLAELPPKTVSFL